MRNVTEPVIPQICTALDAKLTAVKAGEYNSLAASDEQKLDTDRIQDAINSCGHGKAVALRVSGGANAFLSGPLKLREGVTLLVDKGTTLFASLDPKVFELAPGSCGLVTNPKTVGCKPLITVDHAPGSAIMGDGVIDGRGGLPQLGSTLSAWDISEQQNDRRRKALNRLIVANHSDNFTLYRITLKNSQNFHVTYSSGDGFTVWGVKIDTPHRFPRAARPLAHNTDGIDPGSGSKNITVTHSYIRTGDDNIAIKGGNGGLTNMTVSHNHFYWGHGMSIGSETYDGVSKIKVFDLTLDGTDSGLRIKSSGDRGGLVQDVSYEDVCIRNSGRPIDLSAFYADGKGASSRLPVFKDITLKDVTVYGGGQLVFEGFDKDHRVQPTLDNVLIADTAAKYVYRFSHSDVTLGKGGSNISLPEGTDATVIGTPGQARGAHDCETRFVKFPE
jgi:polygalacturonase